MRRRAFLAVLGAGAAWPLAARAQQDRSRNIGILMAYTEDDSEGLRRLAAFRQGLREAGWTDGHNASIEIRWLGGDSERAKRQVKALVEARPDVIVVNGSPGLAAVRDLTRSIPVVFVVVTDPVGAGFVDSLSRPGGNITGFSTFEPEIGGKWVEALKEIAPHVRRVGVLTDPDGSQGFRRLLQAVETVAPSFGVQATALYGRSGTEIDRSIESLAGLGDGGLVVLPTPVNSVHREKIFALTAKHRLPAIYPFAFHARSGGLIAYGFDPADLFRRAGPYVARILNGEQPGDLPVQAPVKFELVVNARAAAAIGLPVPASLLARADEVIE